MGVPQAAHLHLPHLMQMMESVLGEVGDTVTTPPTPGLSDLSVVWWCEGGWVITDELLGTGGGTDWVFTIVLLLLFTALGTAQPVRVGGDPPTTLKGVSTYRFWVLAATVLGLVRVILESKALREGGRWDGGVVGQPPPSQGLMMD